MLCAFLRLFVAKALLEFAVFSLIMRHFATQKAGNWLF
jgi:hypothetical protein